jgi:ribonuclease P protein component
MLPSPNRLKKERDIEKVFKKGKTFKEKFLILRMVDNGLSRVRFGFIVSQKVSKKATVRNKIRRRISEIVRLKLPRLKKGFDVIVIAAPDSKTEEFRQIESSINKIFLKANLLND